MRTFFISLAGCIVKMELVNDIVISERLQPFLFGDKPNDIDVVLEVQECELLPHPEEGGHWEGTNYYVYHEKELRVYHVNDVGESPFSVTCFKADGNVLLLYLKEAEHYFRGSSGVFNRIGAEQLFLQHNRLMLHASFIKHEGKGILFSAPSGTGKSTQAELWRAVMGAEVVNGDRVAVGVKNAEWTAWGIPYAGTSGIYRNEHAPLTAVIILGQAKENRIRRLGAAEALRYLYSETTNHQWDAKFVEKVTGLLAELIATVPVFLLECVPDRSAVECLQNELTKELKSGGKRDENISDW